MEDNENESAKQRKIFEVKRASLSGVLENLLDGYDPIPATTVKCTDGEAEI